jgi:hypothetical protein
MPISCFSQKTLQEQGEHFLPPQQEVGTQLEVQEQQLMNEAEQQQGVEAAQPQQEEQEELPETELEEEFANGERDPDVLCMLRFCCFQYHPRPAPRCGWRGGLHCDEINFMAVWVGRVCSL